MQASATVLGDFCRPQGRISAIIYDLVQVISGSLLIALAAQLVVPLPFTPVPVTAQTLAVLLAGVLLGRRKGTLAAVCYVAGGAAGLPLFAAGGMGLARLLGPTGGYLLGFIAAAFFAGWLAERGMERRVGMAVLVMLAGLAVIYAFGLAWLGFYVGWPRVLALGLLPFIPGEAVKLAAASLMLPACWGLLSRR